MQAPRFHPVCALTELTLIIVVSLQIFSVLNSDDATAPALETQPQGDEEGEPRGKQGLAGGGRRGAWGGHGNTGTVVGKDSGREPGRHRVWPGEEAGVHGAIMGLGSAGKSRCWESPPSGLDLATCSSLRAPAVLPGGSGDGS